VRARFLVQRLSVGLWINSLRWKRSNLCPCALSSPCPLYRYLAPDVLPTTPNSLSDTCRKCWLCAARLSAPPWPLAPTPCRRLPRQDALAPAWPTHTTHCVAFCVDCCGAMVQWGVSRAHTWHRCNLGLLLPPPLFVEPPLRVSHMQSTGGWCCRLLPGADPGCACGRDDQGRC
jgi:hypothetical protein